MLQRAQKPTLLPGLLTVSSFLFGMLLRSLKHLLWCFIMLVSNSFQRWMNVPCFEIQLFGWNMLFVVWDCMMICCGPSEDFSLCAYCRPSDYWFLQNWTPCLKNKIFCVKLTILCCVMNIFELQACNYALILAFWVAARIYCFGFRVSLFISFCLPKSRFRVSQSKNGRQMSGAFYYSLYIGISPWHILFFLQRS